MKKMFMTAVMAVLIGTGVYAQAPEKSERKEISTEALAKRKAAQLMLDDATTAKFIPLYQEYIEAMKANQEAMRANVGEPKKGGEKAQLSDDELDKLITSRFECQQKSLDTQKKYYDKFKKMLTVRQAEQLVRFGQPAGAKRMPRQMGKDGRNGSRMDKMDRATGQQPGQCPQVCPQLPNNQD